MIKARLLFLFSIIIIVETCVSSTKTPLSNIGRDLLDLFINEELFEKGENARICLYLSATKTTDNNRELYITYGSTSLFLKPSFKYKGYDVVIDGNSDGFYWDGYYHLTKNVEKYFKIMDDTPFWEIVQYNDNTINRYLTYGSFEDISDLLKVFDSYGLLKDDSDWAKQHFFSSLVVDSGPKFEDLDLVYAYIRKEFKPIETLPYSRTPAMANIFVSKNGDMRLLEVYVDDNDNVGETERDLIKAECTRVANLVCKNFKMIPAIHRGINVDTGYLLPFNSSFVFVPNNHQE